MSQTGVQVVGAERCAATLSRAGDRLAHQERAAAGTSRVVAAAGRAGAPRRSGTLAMSVRAAPQGGTGVAMTSLRYAPYVHWGTRYMRARPFLTDAARQTEPVWIRLYVADADDALSTVKGA